VADAECEATPRSVAAKNPRYALGAVLRELTLAGERFLAKIMGASVEAIRGYLDEPISSPAFSRHLREAEQNFRELKIMSADLYAKKVLFPYAAEATSSGRNGYSKRSLIRVHFAGAPQESAGNSSFGGPAGWFVT